MPMCRPFRRAKVFFRHRAREWTVTGLRMIRPSLINFLICCPGGRNSALGKLRVPGVRQEGTWWQQEQALIGFVSQESDTKDGADLPLSPSCCWSYSLPLARSLRRTPRTEPTTRTHWAPRQHAGDL